MKYNKKKRNVQDAVMGSWVGGIYLTTSFVPAQQRTASKPSCTSSIPLSSLIL